MKQLYSIKEKIKQFVGKNDVFIIPVLKFLLAYMALSKINKGIGFMSRLTGTPITLIIALAGSFLPVNLTIVILALICLLHVYALSMECAIIVFALFAILFLLYFRFASKDSIAALLTPVSFALKVPYVVPVSMGLVSEPSSIASVGSGVIIYNVLHYISVNAEDIKNMGSADSKITAIKDVTTALIGNRDMLVYVLAFAVTIFVVYCVRRLPVDYCWTYAIVGGSFINLIMIAIGNKLLHGSVSVGMAFLGLVLSIIINIILQFFCFDLDYNRTERVQFEDDEYYYYVKAVPKNTVTLPGEENKKKSKDKKKHHPAKSASAKPAAKRPAERSLQSNTRTVVEEIDKPVSATSVRKQVQKNAAGRAKAADHGFLGFSGGRPAGEGRQRELRQKAERERMQQIRNQEAANTIVKDFAEDDIK